MTAEIIPCERQGHVYPAYSIPWLLMAWRHKEPGHQQPWYWLSYPRIRADSRLALSQWEMSLQCNAVSHWQGANLVSALRVYVYWFQHNTGREKYQSWLESHGVLQGNYCCPFISVTVKMGFMTDGDHTSVSHRRWISLLFTSYGGLEKMANILQMTFWNAFSGMKIYDIYSNSLSVFMARHWKSGSWLPEPMMNLFTDIWRFVSSSR